MADIDNDGDIEVRIVDPDTQVAVEVTSEKRLQTDVLACKSHAARSAFGLFKTSSEFALKNYKYSEFLINTDFDPIVTASGSWSIYDSSIDLNTGASSSSGLTLQTKDNHPYQIGKGQLLKISIILGDSGVAGNIREWGLNSNTDGVFVRLNATAYEFVIKSKSSETVILASNWDVPVTPDEYGHLWYIQYQWLGVGNFNLYYDEQLVHTYQFLGIGTEASMSTPDLPLRLNNQNSTNSTDVKLRSCGASVSQEGIEATKITDGENFVYISHENELRVKPPSSVIFDEHFNAATLDTNVWNTTIVGSASHTCEDSFTKLQTTTADGDSIDILSVPSFRHKFSQTYSFRSGILLPDETLNNNTRIWGMRNSVTNDGWYFRLLNGVLQACTEFSGAITAVNIDTEKPTDGKVHRYDSIYRNYRVIFIIDGVDVHIARADVLGLYDNENLNVYFRNYNTGVTSTATSLNIEGVSLFDDSVSGITVQGTDSNGLIYPVAVSSTRRLLVSQEPPAAPPGTDPKNDVQKSSMTGTQDSTYTITNGKTLYLQRLSGGAEASNSGSIIELYYDPNGDLSVLTAIEDIYAQGASGQKDLDVSFDGDGTRRILLRRRNFGGGTYEVSARWEGYEQTT